MKFFKYPLRRNRAVFVVRVFGCSSGLTPAAQRQAGLAGRETVQGEGQKFCHIKLDPSCLLGGEVSIRQGKPHGSGIKQSRPSGPWPAFNRGERASCGSRRGFMMLQDHSFMML